jgi:hypothetical protein
MAEGNELTNEEESELEDYENRKSGENEILPYPKG